MYSKKHLDKPAVFAAALLVAVGGLIYELILGTAASYLFGDSIVSFSVATGVTLFGMGIGSLLATRLAVNSGINFVRNELVLSLLGGNSVLLLFLAFSLSQLYWVVFVVLSLSIGIAIGIEIPLLVGLLKEFGKKSSVELLSKVLAADYFGALIASLLFPFILLPNLGIMRTAYAVALLNAGVAIFILWRIRILQRITTVFNLLTIVILTSLLGCFIYATRIEKALDSALYSDPVVYYEFSPYQKIAITQHRDDTRLYLSNQLQFSSKDEVRYHETLAHAALTSVESPRDVLILGGGDGLLAREVLKYVSIEHITVVDIDPSITNLARKNHLLKNLNNNAMNSSKVDIRNSDAFQFVRSDTKKYDVIIADLIDPSNERIAKLYSAQFYGMARQRLSEKGVFITQATSTYFTPAAYWQIKKTIETAHNDRSVVSLSQNVPSFGEWGFILSLPYESLPFHAQDLPLDMSFHTKESLMRTLYSPKQMPTNSTVSTLLDPAIYHTYRSDMSQWSY